MYNQSVAVVVYQRRDVVAVVGIAPRAATVATTSY